jgi:predicted deacylase
MDDGIEPTLPPSRLPHFDVNLAAPDLAPWRAGNTGIEGFTSFTAAAPGPHLLLLAIMHGNEIAGAIALDALLRAGLRPRQGRLTFGFANLAAFARFDPEQPTASRYVEEDLNRLWEPEVLDGTRDSLELARARAMRPLIETVDSLVDLHSMLWPSDPLTLSGVTARGRALACAIGRPSLIVADAGHLSGRRLIDFPHFAAANAGAMGVLVETGQHWQAETVANSLAAIGGVLRHLDMVDDTAALPPLAPPAKLRCAEVTCTVTAATAGFAFVQPWRGGDVIARRNTLIAVDGEREIRTPYDDCLLVMPSLRPARGHTAVRLGRFVACGANPAV